MPDIYINTERPVDRSIVAGINQPQRESPIGDLVAGSSYDTNLYFVKNDGTYDAASGDAGANVEVSVSTLAEPNSGTFTLTDGTDTTTAISYGATGKAVEDALNALNTSTGPFGNLVTVEKRSDTQYTVTFQAFGAETALEGASASLYPESVVSASVAIAGDADEYGQQIIEIKRQPAVYQATWSTITDGFNATVALTSTRLLQSLIIDSGLPYYYEVKLNSEVVAREVVGVRKSTIPDSAFVTAGINTLFELFAANPNSSGEFDSGNWLGALGISPSAADEFLVATGAGAWSFESGRTLRATLGYTLGNTIFVAKNGTDSRTGLDPHDIGNPFLTCTAAQSAASSGDEIVVFSGNYSAESQLTGKDGVNWTFRPGAISPDFLVSSPATFTINGDLGGFISLSASSDPFANVTLNGNLGTYAEVLYGHLMVNGSRHSYDPNGSPTKVISMGNDGSMTLRNSRVESTESGGAVVNLGNSWSGSLLMLDCELVATTVATDEATTGVLYGTSVTGTFQPKDLTVITAQNGAGQANCISSPEVQEVDVQGSLNVTHNRNVNILLDDGILNVNENYTA